MSLGAIPPGIQEVLGSKTGYVLLVVGRPGTGKTLLVREILRKVSGSFLVLTDMESSAASGTESSSEIQDWNRRHVVAGPNTYVKSGVTSQLMEELSPLVRVNKDSAAADVIIVDSWSELLESVDASSRSDFERRVMHAARQDGKRLVLVSEVSPEVPTGSRLLHSVDAIVCLQKHRVDQKVYRQMVIEKMRSLPVEQDTYLFTLHQGRFTYIPWHQHTYPPIMVEREPIPDAAPNRISTGNKDLDGYIGGGFLTGTLNLIEVEDVAAPYLETVYIPFLSNHLQLGRPAVVLLPEGWSSERFTDGLARFVDRDFVSDRVVFFGRHALGKENVRGIDADPMKTLQEIRYEAGQLERRLHVSAIEIISLDTLENKFGPSATKEAIAELSASLQGTERVTVGIVSRNQVMKAEAISHTMHLRVQDLCGVLSISGETPRTGFLALRPILTGGFLDYELTPIE